MKLVLKSSNKTNKLLPIKKPLKLPPRKPRQKAQKNQERQRKFGAEFFKNLNIEEINKDSNLAAPTLELVKKTQSFLKYKDMDRYEGIKHLKYLQKKIQKGKNKEGKKSRELSPNNYKHRAEADEIINLERLFQEPNFKYRKKFKPEIEAEETEDERNRRVFWEEYEPVRKRYMPKKKVKQIRLNRFNKKYKGNYNDLEIKGYRGIFENDGFKTKIAKPILKKKNNGEDKIEGGPEAILRRKRERLKGLRDQFLREGWVNGHRVKGSLNFASIAEDNLLRSTLGPKMKKSVRFDEKYLSDTNLGKRKKTGLIRKKISKIAEQVDSEYVKLCPKGCGRRYLFKFLFF